MIPQGMILIYFALSPSTFENSISNKNYENLWWCFN